MTDVSTPPRSALLRRLANVLGRPLRRPPYGSPHHLSGYMLKDIGISQDDLGMPRHRS